MIAFKPHNQPKFAHRLSNSWKTQRIVQITSNRLTRNVWGLKRNIFGNLRRIIRRKKWIRVKDQEMEDLSFRFYYFIISVLRNFLFAKCMGLLPLCLHLPRLVFSPLSLLSFSLPLFYCALSFSFFPSSPVWSFFKAHLSSYRLAYITCAHR